MNEIKKEFNCIECIYNTDKNSDWIKHLKTQKHLRNGAKKITKCEQCEYESHSHWNVKLHIMSQHSTLEERKVSKYYCNTCDLIFFCSTYMEKHMNGKHHMNKIKKITK